MKKVLLIGGISAVLLFGVVAVFIYSTTPHRTAYQWEKQPRVIFDDAAFSGAHDPKISVSLTGDISLLSVSRKKGIPQLQLFHSHNAGDTFPHIVPVSEAGATVDSHGENSPVMVDAERGPAVIWQQTDAQGKRELVIAASQNWGNSFPKPVRVTDSDKARASYPHLATDGKVLYAAWLDWRDGGEETASIYTASSHDGGVTWSKNVRVTRQVCPCCRPNLAVLPNGKLVAAWRKVYPGNIRDITCATSTDGGKTWSAPRRVAVDNWHLNGCPDAGPRLAIAGNRVYAAWYSSGNGTNAGIRLTWSDDAGQSWSSTKIISSSVDNPNQPFLFALPGGNAGLIYRARDSQNHNGWGILSAYLSEIDSSGHISAPTALPTDESISFPVFCGDDAGHYWMAWNGDKGVQLLRGSKSTF